MNTLTASTTKLVLAQIAVMPTLNQLSNHERIELLALLYRDAVYAPIGVGALYDPSEFLCFDNGGKTADRYSIYPDDSNDCLGVCGDGGRKFSQWCTGNRLGMLQEAQSGESDNFLVDWASLPADTILHVRQRLGNT